MPYPLLCVGPPRQHWPPTSLSKKYYQIENAVVHQYPAEVAPATGVQHLDSLLYSLLPMVQVLPHSNRAQQGAQIAALHISTSVEVRCVS